MIFRRITTLKIKEYRPGSRIKTGRLNITKPTDTVSPTTSSEKSCPASGTHKCTITNKNSRLDMITILRPFWFDLVFT